MSAADLLDEIQERMRPGRFSQSGFLGEDEALTEVLDRDANTLGALGVTAGQMAETLRALLEPIVLGRRASGRVGRYWVSVKRYRGSQMCPFIDDPESGRCTAGSGSSPRFASIDWHVRDLLGLRSLRGPGLIVHLIGAHGFFNGVEVPHRVDPRALARLLGLDFHRGTAAR